MEKISESKRQQIKNEITFPYRKIQRLAREGCNRFRVFYSTGKTWNKYGRVVQKGTPYRKGDE